MLVCDGREILAVRYVLHMHSQFFKNLFEDTTLKRDVRDMYRLEVTVPFTYEVFKSAIAMLHTSITQTTHSILPSQYRDVYRVFDFLDVKHSLKINIRATSPLDEKLEFVRLVFGKNYSVPNAWTELYSECLSRGDTPMGAWLDFLAEIRGGLPVRDVRSRIMKLDMDEAFWDQVLANCPAARLSLLNLAVPFVVIQLHAKKRNIELEQVQMNKCVTEYILTAEFGGVVGPMASYVATPHIRYVCMIFPMISKHIAADISARVALSETEIFVLSYSGAGVKLRLPRKTIAANLQMYYYTSWSKEVHQLRSMKHDVPTTTHRNSDPEDFVAVMFTYEPSSAPHEDFITASEAMALTIAGNNAHARGGNDVIWVE